MHRYAGFLSVVFLAGCAAQRVAQTPEAGGASATPEIELKGSRIIGCCCTSPCPCRLNKKPMHCHGCDFTTAVHVDEGHIGATKMDGVGWVIVGRVFAEKPETNWVYLYVSDAATDEQTAALQSMIDTDTKSIEPKKVTYLIGEFKGMRKVPIRYEVSADRRDYGVTIPGVLDFKTRSIVLPGRTEPVMSSGIFDDFGDRFVHADCLAHTFTDSETGYTWDLTGRQSNQADFKLTTSLKATRRIGWACWSAHADFGAQEKYQEQSIGHH
ncbi:MAG: DUF1326 domain-containing protein [Planctomycetota bacterium]